MQPNDYHKKIIDYYQATEHAYKDSWDLDNSLAIHYGYWDDEVKSFPESLVRMNEIMATTARIRTQDNVLDAGCGIGGSSIFLAATRGARVTGITLSGRQVEQAVALAKRKGVNHVADFKVMNYCATTFPDASFDVVWGCESICYADSKEQFINEAWRLLKPGGRMVVADGFVSAFANNDHPVIRKWLDGWQVNYLETPGRFTEFMEKAGFISVRYRDITKETLHSSLRLYRFYFLASAYVWWKRLRLSSPSALQVGNIKACKYQYLGMKRKLWQYGLIVGEKPRQ
ncbi:MAG: methyltransferase domain-containing protein [Chitinophagaceae bacterium]|nr:methyltransferase domain-containing protein [Chitinophagaceae bacterium]